MIVLSCSRAVRDLLASKQKCCDMGGAPLVAVEQRPWCHVLAARPIASTQMRSFRIGSFHEWLTAAGFFHSCRDYVMLPGMKQRIARLPLKYHVQTIVRPARFGSVIR